MCIKAKTTENSFDFSLVLHLSVLGHDLPDIPHLLT